MAKRKSKASKSVAHKAVKSRKSSVSKPKSKSKSRVGAAAKATRSAKKH